jgi:hypothetical protein
VFSKLSYNDKKVVGVFCAFSCAASLCHCIPLGLRSLSLTTCFPLVLHRSDLRLARDAKLSNSTLLSTAN